MSHSGQAVIERLREQGRQEMVDYFKNLRKRHNFNTRDSVARSYNVHDIEHFTLEQDISVCVNRFPKEGGQGWAGKRKFRLLWQLRDVCTDSAVGIVWSDNGSDLSNGTKGPWTPPHNRQTSWQLSLNATPIHRPRIALKAGFMRPPLAPLHQIQQYLRSRSGLMQNAACIPLFFGRLLGKTTAAADPFYALNDLFNFAANSESQFLTMIENKI